MEQIRFATIGTNFIVKKFLEAAQLCDKFKLQAVYSREKETAERFLGSNSHIRVYESLEELGEAIDIDAVYIASPTCYHAKQAIMMMSKGKHVLCEKPIASNTAEWEQMKKAADENQVIIMEAMRPLFTPGYTKIKTYRNELGSIRKVNLNYCQYSSRYDRFKDGIVENAFKKELSNGALMDIGVYGVEVLMGLFGKPKSICAHGYIIPGSIDGYGSIVASYEEMQAIIQYSKITDSMSLCEIQGENGTLYFSELGAPRNISIAYRNGTSLDIEDSNDQLDMIYEIQYFLDCVLGNNSVDDFNEISYMAMELMDQARRQIGISFPADGHIIGVS